MSIPSQPIKLTPKGRPFRMPWMLRAVAGESGRGAVNEGVIKKASTSSLDHGIPPWRIQRRWLPSLGFWAGIQQQAYEQTDYRLFLPIVVIPRIGQINAKSVSGVLGRVTHSESVHVPSVFVPSVMR